MGEEHQHTGSIGRKNAWIVWLPLAVFACYSGGDQSEPAGGPSLGSDDGSTDGSDDPGRRAQCVDTRDFFKERVWNPILSKTCIACHNAEGAAKSTALVLQFPDYPNYLDVNYEVVANVARLDIDGKSLILRKPTMDDVDHGGKLQLDEDSEEYRDLADMVTRFESPVPCYDPQKYADFYAPLKLLDEAKTLRKAALVIAKRLPTSQEVARVRGQGIDSLDAVLDEMMDEDAFYERLRDFYQDKLHTDEYLGGSNALDRLDLGQFPNARFYQAIPEDDPERNRLRGLANEAVAREPMHLIEWVVRNRRPFGEILTADYRIVNPFSALAYDVPLDRFADPTNPDEWIEAQFEGYTQIGLLSSVAWLSRFPTTPTNRNRHRARMMYELFFSTDIMRLAGRAIDVSAVDDDNPTLFNAKCTVCHDNIDAWAGAFRHWDGGGRYRPETVWHTDMVPTAFAGEALPSDARENPLGWLAGKIIDDERFAMSVVHTIYEGLTGTAPLAQPIDALSETYLADARAYDAQDYMLMHIAQGFRESGQDVRVVVKELIKSPWFRASGAAGSLTDEQRAELAGIGTARMLAPEILHDKIVATTGYPWRRDGVDVLLNSGAYRLLYGGIDPTQLVTERLTGMNGMIASIAERMANDVSCTTVAVDFAKPQAERLLFGDVEITDQPEDDRVAIAASLRHLHERLWGESLEWGDPDLDRALTLFTEVWLDGRAGIEAGEYPLALPGRCQAHQDPLTGQAFAAPIVEDPDYTVRAWMVVVSYMLGDFRYLYE